MTKVELYAGVLIAGGQVQDLVLYANPDCCRDTLRDSVRRYQNAAFDEFDNNLPNTHPAITSATMYRVVTGTHNEDGFWRVLDLDLGTLDEVLA